MRDNLNDHDLYDAVVDSNLPALGRHVAHWAYDSACVNEAADPYAEAINRVDDWSGISNICNCDDLRFLSDDDLRAVARVAASMLEG